MKVRLCKDTDEAGKGRVIDNVDYVFTGQTYISIDYRDNEDNLVHVEFTRSEYPYAILTKDGYLWA